MSARRPFGAVVQAGGRGSRLRSAIGGLNKALAPFGGSTLLGFQLRRVRALGPEFVCVLLHDDADRIRQQLPPDVVAIVEPSPLGSAGGLSLVPQIPSRWLVLNVDHVSDADLGRLVDHPASACALVQRFLVDVDEGVVDLDGSRIAAVRERPRLPLVRTLGAYAFDSAVLGGALDGAPCEMPELLRRLLPLGVEVVEHEGQWFDAGVPERLERARRWWAARAGTEG